MWDLVRDQIKELLGKLPRVITAAILLTGVALFVAYKFYDFKDATFRQVVEQRPFQTAALTAIAVIWIIAGIIVAIAYLRRPRLTHEVLAVAVANFFGNSDLANDEARGLRTLIRQELNRRIARGDAMRLVGELDAPVVADTAAGIRYGKSVLAHLVIGGDVTALGKEIKFQPLICLASPFEAPGEKLSEPGAVTLQTDAPNHLQLAESSVRNFADLLSGISGLGAFQRGNFAVAIRMLGAIADKTADVWTYLAVSHLYTNPQNIAEADTAAASAVAARPDDGVALNVLGAVQIAKALRGMGRLEDAQGHLEQASRVAESAPAALNNLSIVAMLRGDQAKAEQLLRKAIRLVPERIRPRANLAGLLLSAGRAGAAEKVARDTLKRGEDPVARHLLGRALFNQKRYKEALDQYEIAVKLNGTYAVAFNSIGEVCSHLERPADSIAAFDRALALKPDYAHAYNNKGVVLKKLGQIPEAETNFRKAIALNAKYADPWGNLINLYSETKREKELDDARRHYEALKQFKSGTGDYPVFTIRGE